MNYKLPNAVVGQSGGPTSAINASLYGAICGIRDSGKFGTLFGMRNGIDGLLNEALVELNYLYDRDEDLELLKTTPASILGACRTRLPDDMDHPVYEKIFGILEKNGIGCFFYIGGNDSMDTVAKLSRYSKEKSKGVSVIGVPKTIDNDLMHTDHTPGYGSACKYVATTVSELAYDVSVYTIPAVTIVEIMGRETGWLACAAALSREISGMGADLVYLPEGNFTKEGFLRDVRKKLSEKNFILVCVSEGIEFSEREVIQLDSFGHSRLSGIGKVLEGLVAKEIGCKVRSIELSLMQRCSAHLASRTDIEEGALLGKRAVEYALDGECGKMLCLVRGQGEYSVTVSLVEASLVANLVKCVPKSFIDEANGYVTEECINYLLPLIQGEIDIEYKGGIPRYFKLD